MKANIGELVRSLVSTAQRLPQILNPRLYFRRDPSKYFEDGMYVENNDAFRRAGKFILDKKWLVARLGYDYKMDWRTHIATSLAQYAKSLDGDFIELGCGEGWIGNAILLSSNDILTNRSLYFFDKFDGMSVDIQSGMNIVNTHPNYPKSKEQFVTKLATTEGVVVVEGLLPGTLQHFTGDKVAFLHIDLNAAPPEVAALRHLYPKVTSGGVILLDDYCGRGREVQFEAMNNLGRELKFQIISLPTGQGLILKS